MALALFADDDYEEVAARLTETLREWCCWDDTWEVPTSGGVTQARQRLGFEPVKELFAQVAAPVAEEETPGAFMGTWRLMAIDGLEWDAPTKQANIAAFGPAREDTASFAKVRVATVSECGSHAMVDARIGGVAGKGAGEQSLARPMLRRLEEDWLLISDRNFYNWDDWCVAADTRAAMLWRVKADLRLPVLQLLPDGRTGRCWSAQRSAARPGKCWSRRPAAARTWRRTRPGISGSSSTKSRPRGNGKGELKTYLRGPGRVLRSGSPDMGAPGDLRLPAGPLRDQCPDLPGSHRRRDRPGPGQVQAHRLHPAPPGGRPGLSPEQRQRVLARIMADITRRKNLNRRHRSYPRVVKRARHNSYRVKRPGDTGTWDDGPATIKLVNLRSHRLAA